jgi:hypothetical protein
MWISAPLYGRRPILGDIVTVLVRRLCRIFSAFAGLDGVKFRRLRTNELAQSQEPLTAAPSAGEPKTELPSANGGELPSGPTPRPSVKMEPVAAKDSSAAVADPKVPDTPIAEASMTNETPVAKDLHNYVLGAGFIVMTVWLLIVLFGKAFIRRTR